MARTAPFPNIPAIPGMNPGVWIMGGGGSGGGRGGKGGKGNAGAQGANGNNGGNGPEGGGKNAGSCGPGSGGGCMNPVHGNAALHAGDPVDIATGRVYTLPQTDLVLTGVLVLPLQRTYSSSAAERDIGLGHGWSHTLAWSIELRRRTMVVHTPDGAALARDLPPVGGAVKVPGGGLLRRDSDGFVMALDSLFYGFVPLPGAPDQLVLASLGDRKGNRISLDYDAAGRLVGGRDSLDREVRFPRGADGHIETMALVTARGRVASYRRYEYDGGDLVATVDNLGRRTTYTYDAEHRLVRLVYPSLTEVHYRYDEQGRCIETWCVRPGDSSLAADVPATLADGTAAKGVLHVQLEHAEDSVTVIDSRQTRRFDIDGTGKIGTGAGVWVEQVGYDEHHEPTHYSDPNGQTTQFLRDDRGRLTAVVEPSGARTTYAYTPSGELREEVDALGYAAEYEWDDTGLLREVRDALGPLVRYSYDARGLRTAAEMPNGGRSETAYDAEANPVRVVEPDGSARDIAYDDEGRVVLVRDAEGLVTRFGYDAMGALREVVTPSGGAAYFERDPDGRLARYVDPTGATFDFIWGGYGVVTGVRKPTGETLALRYDREQNLVEARNERGEVHRFHRDLAGRVVGERGFDGRERRYELDGAGRMKRFTDAAGHVTTIERDVTGRLAKRTFVDDRVDAFQHDDVGRLVRAETEATVVSYAHDSRGNVIREEQIVGGERVVIETSFDATGAVAGRRYTGGPTVHIERDPSRRPVRVIIEGAGELKRIFDGLGREVLRELPGGGRVTSRWQGMAGLAERRVLSAAAPRQPAAEPQWVGDLPPGTVYAEAFARNEMGALVEHIADGMRTAVTLDPLGRVTERRSSDGRAERYEYRGGGRLYDAQEGAAPRQYAAGGALAAWGDVAFAYDAEARRTEERDTKTGHVTRHIWDGRGLLVATELPDGTRVEHVYDAHARRLEKRVTLPGGARRVTRFVWSGEHLIHERTTAIDATGARVVAERAYVLDDDGQPLAHVDIGANGQPSFAYYILGEGDFPALLLGGDGRVLERLRPSVWGRVDGGATRATPLRFLGQYEDAETGLFYNRYRFYDPRVGLFVNADPIGISGSWNAFEYAQSTPWMVVDPEGLEGVLATITGGGVTGEGSSKSISGGNPDIHPVVADALPKPTKHGDKDLWPKGAHNPTNCAEPRAISDYLRKWEEKHNGGKPLDPNNPQDHAKIQKAMQDINQVTAKQESGKGRAPCPNCSQLLSNLKDKWGGPKTNAVTPGASSPNATDRVRSTPSTDKRWKKAFNKGKVK